MPVPIGREGIGDHPGRWISEDPGGFLEYRVAPAFMVEIVNIEVSNDHRREGVGRRMIERMLKDCRALGVKAVFAVTRRSNRIAQDFYRGMGFAEVAVLKGFYPGDNPDAIMYRRAL